MDEVSPVDKVSAECNFNCWSNCVIDDVNFSAFSDISAVTI